jgi:hypothetical protein
MSTTTNQPLPHEIIPKRSIPWHEMSQGDLALAMRISHRACTILQALIEGRQISLLPHQQMPDPKMLAMDVCVLKLCRPSIDLHRLLRCDHEDFMDDIVALLQSINRVDGLVPSLVHFRCDASVTKN